MPFFKFEAMDATGQEIMDTLEAEHEAEAQNLVRQRGFFLTKIRRLEGPEERGAETGKWLKTQKPDSNEWSIRLARATLLVGLLIGIVSGFLVGLLIGMKL